MKIITRFPPSPTGNMQLGNARTALFNYLFAKNKGGSFLFRLEDTDKERSKKEFEIDITDSMKWLGLTYDNTVVWRQTERTDIYKAQLKKLVDTGHAYVSKETDQPQKTEESYTAHKQDGERRAEVIRFKNPNKSITFTDLIRGDITFDTTELGDFVIAKSMEEPIYHLAVVIDDAEMGITHVIRGEDGISNTPRQILIQEALGFTRPTYAHLPLILAPDRTKLSKRKGAIPVSEYRARGYLPEAVVNYLTLLGWNPGTDQELFSIDELIQAFDISKVQKSGAVFDEEKMKNVNREYIKKRGKEALLPYMPEKLTQNKSTLQLETLCEIVFDRISVYGDIRADVDAGEYDYAITRPNYPKEQLVWKKAKSEPLAHLEKAVELLKDISAESFSKDGVKNALMPYAETAGKGDVLWPVRVALSGRDQSPDPFTLATLLGKDETLERLSFAIELLR
ncbi:MAG: glutamate--tRNA ligase [Candidatus Taylorbacteria bacterium CG11_big_fil_rev_8_21_14_0_20_46_11]|uniref:Glutamate--tRNA ligase n=1 Tax=Candidatus Taylorbacteria bacterium CG11_big_fil_rev_8_21_14_0_20_46_11 TaxID=1975025 RepID=A0A2H0KA80_9BACT|nr:MAG: glutamate--tRNA ligase [Candidatus Taylorbacteria bacterium CG11_big_fil_rev_8_21_14_0_20_46_11]